MRGVRSTFCRQSIAGAREEISSIMRKMFAMRRPFCRGRRNVHQRYTIYQILTVHPVFRGNCNQQKFLCDISHTHFGLSNHGLFFSEAQCCSVSGISVHTASKKGKSLGTYQHASWNVRNTFRNTNLGFISLKLGTGTIVPQISARFGPNWPFLAVFGLKTLCKVGLLVWYFIGNYILFTFSRKIMTFFKILGT